MTDDYIPLYGDRSAYKVSTHGTLHADDWEVGDSHHAPVTLKDGSPGTINGQELDLTGLAADLAIGDLTDVDLSTPPEDGQVLVYDENTGTWIPGDQTGGGGGTAGGSYAETIGDGIETEYTVIHDLGTTDIIVQVWDLSGADPVLIDTGLTITVIDADTINVEFSSAPGEDEARVVVLSGGAVSPAGNGLGYGPAWVKPVIADFGWINQGGATAVDDDNGIYLSVAAEASYNLRILKKAAPATPYTLTALFLANLVPINYSACGLLWRQSADGKLVTVQYWYSSALALVVSKYNSPTSWSAYYLNQNTYTGDVPGHIWFRMTDNGTNRIVSISKDGENYIQLHSIGRADFMTADEIGFFVAPQQTTFAAGIKLLHWEIT